MVGGCCFPPWPAPLPLTRAWCIWEAFSTLDVEARFDVMLGPEDRDAFARGLLLDGYAGVYAALARVDVGAARAGNPTDERMIKDAVRRLPGGGFSHG